MKKRTKIICAVAAVIILLGAMAGLYLHFKPEAQEGAKTVTVEVVDDKGESVSYEVHTDAKYLTGVLEDAEKEGLTFHGTKGSFGLTIDTVNGLTADYNTGGAYWAFNVNGEYCNYGPDEQPAADGDEFQIVYSIWKEE